MLAQTWRGVKPYVVYRFNRRIVHQNLVGARINLVGRGSCRATKDLVNQLFPATEIPESNL
jgi:hypothetical protein